MNNDLEFTVSMTIQPTTAVAQRRMVRVPVTYELLPGLFGNPGPGRIAKCVSGIPADAEFVEVARDDERGQVAFVFAHESFAPVPHASPLPEVRPVYREWVVE